MLAAAKNSLTSMVNLLDQSIVGKIFEGKMLIILLPILKSPLNILRNISCFLSYHIFRWLFQEELLNINGLIVTRFIIYRKTGIATHYKENFVWIAINKQLWGIPY